VEGGVGAEEEAAVGGQDDDGAGRGPAGDRAREAGGGRFAAEGREEEPRAVPVAPGEEGDARVAEAAAAVVEDEVVGIGGYTFIYARGASYLTDDPAPAPTAT
jgi:hypothetical protein